MRKLLSFEVDTTTRPHLLENNAQVFIVQIHFGGVCVVSENYSSADNANTTRAYAASAQSAQDQTTEKFISRFAELMSCGVTE